MTADAVKPKRRGLKQRLIEYLGDDYQEVDNELIDLYCTADKTRRKIARTLGGDTGKLTYSYTNKAGATNEIKSPLLPELARLTQLQNNILKSLGLTAAQRKKASKPAAADSFDEF